MKKFSITITVTSNQLLVTAGIVMLLLSWLPILVLTNYVHPLPDDFSKAAWPMVTDGFWQRIWSVHLNWTGRYIASIIEHLNPFVWGNFLLMRMTLMLSSIAFIFSTVYFFHTMNRYYFKCSKALVWFVSGLFFLLYALFNMGDLQLFLWWSGHFNYIPFIAATLWLCILCTKYFFDNPHGAKRVAYLVCIFFLLPLFIAGGVESIALLTNFSIALTAALLYCYGYKREAKFFAILLLVTAAFSAVSFFAPGNFVRAIRTNSPIAEGGGEMALLRHSYASKLLVSL